MKKTIFLFLLMATALSLTGQTKKVAILETVDKEGNVPYGIRLQLRSNLTYAISSTPGYEGLDRVDMSSIMGEHNFQRTGMVSDEQIRRLGEMTGASSILVAEAAVYDNSHIIITAKILNVETAGVENSAPPQIASTNPEQMQNACAQLAAKLIGSSAFETRGNTPSGDLNGHRWVNLGLPSGTLWATCNVGAYSSKDYGGFYAWGETKTKAYYGDENYKFSYGPTEPWGDRTVRAVQYDYGVLRAEDDAATVNWGDGWRTPTNEEWGELIDNCTWTKVSDGYKVIGNNGNSIFLPSAGYKPFDKHLFEYGGKYMSSTRCDLLGFYMEDYIDGRYVGDSKIYISGANPRFGLTVRPVCSSKR